VCSSGTALSGPVPGGIVVLRATTLRDGGEGAGLDGFSLLYYYSVAVLNLDLPIPAPVSRQSMTRSFLAIDFFSFIDIHPLYDANIPNPTAGLYRIRSTFS
jgi:hypothetical protein